MQRLTTLPGAVMLMLAGSQCVTNDRLFDDSVYAADDAAEEPREAVPLESAAATAEGMVGDAQLEAQSEGQSTRPFEPPSTGAESSPEVVVEEGAAPCASKTIGPGDAYFELLHAEQTRKFFVHVPDSYDARSPVPLVVDLHGMLSTAAEQANLSGWREKSDAEGFIVVYPEGLDGSWNGGELCCGSSLLQDIDDEGFIRAVVRRLQEDACVDAKRIYASGLSSGGAMAHLLACRAADVFAATAPVSMGNGTSPCEPSRPISVVMIRGTLDLVVPFDVISLFPGAMEDFVQWRDVNGCTGSPQPREDSCSSYRDCAGGVEVVACSILGQHVLYDNITDFSVPDAAWAVFERHALP
jgi:polyhydroxybutyrate depolymerase